MSDVRLVALDLDGTLLSSGLKVSDANAEAVRGALDAGVRVVLATSRWFALARRTADRLGIDTPIIASNGALVRDTAGGRELLHLRLDHELARAVAALADERGWETFTTIDDATFMRPRPGIIPERLPAGLHVSQHHAEEVDRGQPTAVLIFSAEAVEEVPRRFLDGYRERAGFSINRPVNYPHYVVLTHPQADKGRALELVCRQLDVPPPAVMAMGDSESDIGMLRAAGLGIAMDNAPDAVKREALHIAPNNDADGVAWAIRRFAL